MFFKKSNIPNSLTIFRILTIPVLILSYFTVGHDHPWINAFIFTLGAVTDALDGFLARIWSVQSDFGAYFDPIADKLIIVTSIVMIVHIQGVSKFTIIPCIIIMFREILISGLREFFTSIHISIKVSKMAKYKTLVQNISIVILMMNISWANFFGEVMLWIASFLTAWSGCVYLFSAYRSFSGLK